MKFIRFLILTLIISSTLSSCVRYTFKSSPIVPPDSAFNIALTDQNTQPFQLTQLKGKVVLVFFGYTNCPDICPATLSDLQLVKNRLGTAAANVVILFVTVDPGRDTPAKLNRFVQQYDESIIALTGNPADLGAVYHAYGAGAERRDTPNSAMIYAVDHTSTVTVIDKNGMRRLLIGFGSPIDDIASDINALLAE